MVKGIDDRVRSSTLKRLIAGIQIEFIKKGMNPPSAENITKAIIKKYKITKEGILYDGFIKF